MKSIVDAKTLHGKQSKPAVLPIELEEQIRRRAYEMWEQRNRGDGHDVEDWLDAETELKSQALAA
jgi:hypothetical protein